MIKKSPHLKSILIFILISSSLLIVDSCKQINSNKNNSFSIKDTLISPANLTMDVNNLIKVGGTDNYYIFEAKNQKESYKRITCWADLYEEGQLKTSAGKLTSELLGSDKAKYVSIALNKSSIDNSTREFIMSIISDNVVSQGRFVDEIDLKLGEASAANQEQKLIEGQDINLAVFIESEGSSTVFSSITENMKELLKNKKVYIFKCKFEK